jgi:hypothetical protein
MATFPIPNVDEARSIISSRPNVKDAPSTLELSEPALRAFLSSVIESNFYRSHNAFDMVLKKLWTLTDLPKNWSSDESEVPSISAINRAEAILHALRELLFLPYEVGPSSENGTFFGFKGRESRRAAIECLNDGTAYAVLYDKQEYCRTLMIDSDDRNLDGVLSSVINYIRENTQFGPAELRR